jgi:hypothetical protein
LLDNILARPRHIPHLQEAPIRPTLVILAAGLSTRYGGPKQLAPVGPSGEALLDYGIYDAHRAGFGDVVFVIRTEQEETFREHAEWLVGSTVPVCHAFQTLGEAPSDRVKPWGTAHAVLATAPHVHGPFAVMNADDFYGARSFAALAEFLMGLGERSARSLAMVGYRLQDTLSESGGVSRGICTAGTDGRLQSVAEVREIRRGPGGITGESVSGESMHLTGDEIASMNLWGCTPAVFPLLESRFARFLETAAVDPAAEFLLAGVVSDELAGDAIAVDVLPSPDRWFGMTFPEDRGRVAARLAELVSQGLYPDNLSAWFRTHGETN